MPDPYHFTTLYSGIGESGMGKKSYKDVYEITWESVVGSKSTIVLSSFYPKVCMENVINLFM